MPVKFHKYQGNGNDFVVLDAMQLTFDLTSELVRKLCDRRFGIGADGLILVKQCNGADFEMVYANADGHVASMCGNGGRCAVAFAFANGMAGERCSFNAYDGLHQGIIHHAADFSTPYDVSITMGDVERIEQGDNFYFLDTGSPHYVEFVKKVAEIDVVMEGRKTRNSYRFAPDGTNVNFVEVSEDRIFVRTYERGVEDETLSCGTGVTAAAIAAYIETGKKDFKIHTTGGDFRVSFEDEGGTFTSLLLRGPAEMVFRGDFEL